MHCFRQEPQIACRPGGSSNLWLLARPVSSPPGKLLTGHEVTCCCSPSTTMCHTQAHILRLPAAA